MSSYVYMAMELAEWGKGVLKLRRMVMGVGAGPAVQFWPDHFLCDVMKFIIKILCALRVHLLQLDHFKVFPIHP